MKFGKHLNPVISASTLRLRDYLTVPMPPASRDWDHGIASWGMMGNDQYGDCTIAAVGHAIQETTANTATEVTIPDATIESAYFALTGGPDSGLNEQDVLKYWQGTGIGGHQLAGYASCSLSDLDDVRACINLFGGCYIGFVVPDNCIAQFNAGQPWDDSGTATQDGHAVWVCDFDATGGALVTWSKLQRFTWAWWHKFVDEAWGLVLPEWLLSSGNAPSGLNITQLLADVQQLQQAPTPGPTPPVWVPNAQVLAWLTWQAQMGAYLVNAYTAGDVADTKQYQAQLTGHEAGINGLVQTDSGMKLGFVERIERDLHRLPTVVPPVPTR